MHSKYNVCFIVLSIFDIECNFVVLLCHHQGTFFMSFTVVCGIHPSCLFYP